MTRVLRLGAGERVELFDGLGTLADAEIVACERNSVELRVLGSRKTFDGSHRPISVATAVPKGDRFRWLVEKATELGVRRIVPIRTRRSVVHPGAGKLNKMRNTVVAACKQSGRSRLMEIGPLTDWDELIARDFAGHTVLLADPAGERVRSVMSEISANAPLLLVVGPEGGLDDEEIEAAIAAGASRVKLGERILRIETAALALAAFCQLAGDS